MKIEDVLRKSNPVDQIIDFLDKDTSGEVYRSRELAEKLNLTLRSVACISNNIVEKYRTGVFSSSVGKEVLWWGNPVAIQQLKEALNKYGQS